jgi:hypothetical protein
MRRAGPLLGRLAIPLDHLQALVPGGGRNVGICRTGFLCRDDEADTSAVTRISCCKASRFLGIDTG